MLNSIARVAGIVALLCPTVLSAVLPAEQLHVPWKRDGIYSRSPNKAASDYGCEHGPSNRECWSEGFNIDTDMDEKWPETGKTVVYHLEVTNTTMAFDGVARPVMVVNGQYPGPLIEANWGDTLEIHVKNSLQNNGTGIHWHGFRQLNTNQMDGTNGLTECPIAPGVTKVYKFKATQYGTSWYHSHYSVQYADGVVGTIIIHGPSTANYDIDLGTLPITDWFQKPIFTVNAAALHATGPPTADTILINGTGLSNTGGKAAVTELTPGKKHLIRIINTGINAYFHVTADGHPFTVVAADFVPIVPYKTDSLVLAVGQRYDVIIEANQEPGNYWFRVGPGGNRCDGPIAGAANGKSVLRYKGCSEAAPNSTGIVLPTGCYDETNIVPYVKTTVPQGHPEGLKLGFQISAAKGNLVQWLVNDSSLQIDFKKPTLQYVIDKNFDFPTTDNVFTVGEINEWQYWVIQQANGTPPLPHPIHLHGHDFYVLDSAANAQWDGDITRLKKDNPIRRDTATLPAGGYLVLAFESDNPGAWLMHCHIPFHVSAGLALQFLERQNEILDKIGDVSGLTEGCKSWTAFEKAVAGGFIIGDSGL
jgi:FtsP/CotA-like multicopper oxidase with cupredoxin domain